MTQEEEKRYWEDRWHAADAKIQAAYWAFTRQARAKPPFLVCPEAYAERELAGQHLSRLRKSVKSTLPSGDGST